MKKAHEKKNTGFITKIEMKKPSAKILYYKTQQILLQLYYIWLKELTCVGWQGYNLN